MQNLYKDSNKLETLAKDNYCIPPFIMMENAANCIKDLILQINQTTQIQNVYIFCGKGNNGGDGFALARKLQNIFNVKIYAPIIPSAEEANVQYQIAQKLQLSIDSDISLENIKKDFASINLKKTIVVDCFYGTGFKGELSSQIKQLFDFINSIPAVKIACDIPSAFYFNADYTVTMGCNKLCLYSDSAKNVCGKILVANLGIAQQKFENFLESDAFLIQKNDIKLPWRTKKASHKGNFGHVCVFAGEKSGAAIINATSALKFGSGLVTLLQSKNSNLNQFQISPELMISNSIPSKTTCVTIGSGFGLNNSCDDFINWFCNSTNPSCVIDADFFYNENFVSILQKLNSVPNAKIILTPHPKELQELVKKFLPHFYSDNIEEIKNNRDQIGKEFTKQFSSCILVMKGANTFIASNQKIYVCDNGNPSLAKAGSGDVLVGFCAALLAQGYSAHDAAITAVFTHAETSNLQNGADFDFTPFKIIQNAINLKD